MRLFFSLFIQFLRIGAFTFGGGVVIMAVIDAELRKLKMFSDEDVADMVVVASSTPGALAVNMAYMTGFKVLGFPGAVACVAGVSVAPFFFILFFATLLKEFMGEPWLKAFLTGASAGVVVIFGNTLFKMLKTSLLKSVREFIVFVFVIAVVLWFKIHPFLGLVLGTVLALVIPQNLFSGLFVKDKDKVSVKNEVSVKNKEGKSR